ncbi:hypothetical protein QYE76_031567 [Lolium multiflorum]|uniref:Uncharacterized protein n=1 Tax=Lolium multiflorum TaxID=4521 RepID=A0AAD8VIK5_LOLMU|nr:hypothetical protein QYE76_031567 [Lolium multiflorum]
MRRPPCQPCDRLFAYLTPFDLKTPDDLTKLQKDSRGAAAIAKLQFGGQKSLFRHPAGTGKCPRKPSPSTPSPPSCSEPVEEEIDEPESSLDEKEEEIDELESSLDEKEEESDEQKEEEWISYPCQPSNESNSLSLTLFDCPPCLPEEVECYVPVDSLEIVPMSNTCENDYATVIYDNPCYFDKSYDNALFVPDVEMHERLFGQYSRNWTKSTPKILFFPEASRTPKKSRRRARGPPGGWAARASPRPRPYEEATLSALLRRLFAYLTPFDLKTPDHLTKLQKDSRGAAAIAKLQFGGQKSLSRHPAGTGKCPRKPSPSTPSPPSCSVSSSPMDYGF